MATGIAMALGCTAMAAAVIGAGMYLGAPRDAFADATDEIAALPADSVVAKTPPIAARFPSLDEQLAAVMRRVTPDMRANPTFAFAIPLSAQIAAAEADIRTGAATRSSTERPRLASLALYNPKAADEAKSQLPLPRARTQLASLTPSDELKLTPQEDTSGVRTAIYDITAQALYMPSGEKFEAHSGFGAFMDSPRHVHLKMKGATPPNTYRLTMRESLFHGVEAIRMNPENEGAMFNRAGILVHPYMLGPTGQSNGCISLKEYGKFLAAFKRGEVERIVVVSRLDQPPAAYAQANPLASTASTWKTWLQKIF